MKLVPLASTIFEPFGPDGTARYEPPPPDFVDPDAGTLIQSAVVDPDAGTRILGPAPFDVAGPPPMPTAPARSWRG